MLSFLRDGGPVSERKLRLFAVACCRYIWHLLMDPRLTQAVEVAEQHADGQGSQKGLRAAAYALWQLHNAARWRTSSRVCTLHAVRYTCCPVDSLYQVGTMTSWAVFYAAGRNKRAAEAERAEKSFQCGILRDLFGCLPFRPPLSLSSAILAWNGGTVPKLAQEAYEQRRLPAGLLDNARLAVLADALEEAGCTDEEILSHCRLPSNHVRGCWLLDQILGRV
jgi:hypothetical protein